MAIQALEKAIENLEKRAEWLELQMRLVHRTLDKIDRKTEPLTAEEKAELLDALGGGEFFPKTEPQTERSE